MSKQVALEQALLAWFNAVLPTVKQIKSLAQLSNGDLLTEVLQTIPEFRSHSDRKKNPSNSWAITFSNLKLLHSQLQSYYREVLQSFFDPTLVDLLGIAQGKLQTHLSLCLMVFGAAVQASNKDAFIQAILRLDKKHQAILMGTIQEYHFYNLGSEPEDQATLQVKELLSKVESLEHENANLEKALHQEVSNRMKWEGQYKNLWNQKVAVEKELDNMRNSFDTRSMTSSASNNEVNSAMLEELKERMIEQQKYFHDQKNKLLDEIEFLKENLHRKQVNTDAYPQPPVLINQTLAQPDHPPCISVAKHTKMMLNQSEKVKELTRKEWDLSNQNIKLQNRITQLNKECNKLREILSRGEDSVTQKDYQDLEVQVLNEICNGLKEKLRKKQVALHEAASPLS